MTRLSILPIEDQEAWRYYKIHAAAFWSAEEISFSEDKIIFDGLSAKEQKIILNILAFFSFADTLVNVNLQKYFLQHENNTLEVNAFYGFQSMIEMIHAEVYSLQILELIRDPRERQDLFNSVEKYPNVQLKTAWINQWIKDDKALYTHRLLAFVLIEGIFFSSSFATIYYFKKKGVLLNGLIHSNELISRDEYLHQTFGAMMFKRNNSVNRLPISDVHAIVSEAVAVETQFASDILGEALPGLNYSLMAQYIRYLANTILKSIGYPCLFDPVENENPFDFMKVSYAIETKSNFFEKQESSYQRAFGNGYLNEIDFSNL